MGNWPASRLATQAATVWCEHLTRSAGIVETGGQIECFAYLHDLLARLHLFLPVDWCWLVTDQSIRDGHPPPVDGAGQRTSTSADHLSATRQFCWPPAGSFVTTSGHDLIGLRHFIGPRFICPAQGATTTNASTAAPDTLGEQRNNLWLMAPSGSSQTPPGGASPEEMALRGFPPDAGAYADGVSYFQDGLAAVMVSFPGNRPSLKQLVRCHGDKDWRPAHPQEWPPIDLNANRDLAEQLLGKTLGPARVIEARGSRGTSADGTDMYIVELKLQVAPRFRQI